MLEQLRKRNNSTIFSVNDERFRTYGRVIEGVEFSEFIEYMIECTEIPAQGNVYVPSVAEMEVLPSAKHVQNILYGGMPIQIGYCNGRNTTYNGFEYHKGSEINIAVSDFMLVLGHTWDIKARMYHVDEAEVFFVERGTAIEMYQTTLHLSPCRTCDEGFKDVVVLPRGTNTTLERKGDCADPERVMLLQKNKWVIAHPEREALMKQGAYPGVIGPNKELKY